MSRIGKLPVVLPSNVKCQIEGNKVRIEGPKGALEETFHSSVLIRESEGTIRVEPREQSRIAKAMYGTTRSILNNMVIGVVDGYSKNLEISGVGFKADLRGDIINLALGYSHPINQAIPATVKVTVTDGTKIKVEGVSKQEVGQLAASIKGYFPVEPYKGKGVRIVGEHVRRKEGKKTA
jgi:large subunit ribosomal protein L6